MNDRKRIISVISISICLLFIMLLFNQNAGYSGHEKDVPGGPPHSTRATLVVGPGQAYTTIQSAIDAASAGDTVQVMNGTYYENVMITKKMDLVGSSSKDTIIDGKGYSDAVDILSSNVNISHVKITNASDTFYTAGIYMESADDVRFFDMNLENNPSNGIREVYCDYIWIENSTINNSNYGIRSDFSPTWTICNSTISNCYVGYYDEGTVYNNISNNTFKDNSNYGIRTYGEASKIKDNIFSNNNIGLKLSGPDNNVSSNFFTNDTYSGITLESSGNVLYGNEFQDCYQGIVVYSSSSFISNNDLSKCEIGLVLSNALNTVLTRNRFMDCGILFYGDDFERWEYHAINASNTVNGGPLIYRSQVTGGSIPTNAGQVILAGCTNITIQDLVLDNCTAGIQVAYCTNVTIENNTIYDASIYGVYTKNVARMNLTRNRVIRCQDGIYIDPGSDFARANGNVVAGSDEGIFTDSKFNLIEENTVYENNIGIRSFDSNNYIANNTLWNNHNSGIAIVSNDNYVSNNTISNGGSGIYIYGARRSVLKNNELSKTGVDVNGFNLASFTTQSIDSSNTVNNRPILYLKNQTGVGISDGFGQVIIANCTDISADGLDIQMTTYGVSIAFCQDVKINGSVLSNDSTSLEIDRSSNIMISNNVLSDNSVHGLIQYDSSDVSILNNTIERNSAYGVDMVWSGFSIIAGNTISENGWDGIYFDEAHDSAIDRNTISDNGHAGLNLTYYSSFNEVHNNTILQNHGAGIWILAWSMFNDIHHNNIMDNGINAYDIVGNNTWNASLVGNYWSDHTSPDADNDGMVDLVNPVPGTMHSVDHHPIAVPFWSLYLKPLEVEAQATEDKHYLNMFEVYTVNEPPQPYEWRLDTNASWLSLDQNGVLNGTPSNEDVGSYWVNATIFHDDANYDFKNFTLNVSNANDGPIITTVPDQTCLEDETYLVDFASIDIDPTNDIIVWGLATDASFLSLNATSGELRGLPGNSDVGKYWIMISASDQKGGKIYLGFNLTVVNVNDPPEIVSDNLVSCFEDKAYKVNYEATDIDPTGDVLNWGLRTNATFLDMDPITGQLRGTPENSDVGTYSIKVNVTDGHGGIDWSNFTLTVTNVNDPPVGNDSSVEMAEDAIDFAVNVSSMFVDQDNDPLTFKVYSNNNILVNVSGPTVYLTPVANWNGIETLSIEAFDGGYYSSAYLVVNVTPVNDAPSLVFIKGISNNSTIWPDITLNLSAQVQDVDLANEGDSFEYTWTSSISGSLGRNRKLENLTLPVGQHTITVVATDRGNLSVSSSIVINVVARPVIEPDEPREDNSMLYIIIICIVIVMLLILILAFMLVRRSFKSREEPSDHDDTPEEGPGPAPPCPDKDDFNLVYSYYEILGVSRDATETQIKKAYRRKSKECHPDVTEHVDDKHLKRLERTQGNLNKAKEILLDPERRAVYDRHIGHTKGQGTRKRKKIKRPKMNNGAKAVSEPEAQETIIAGPPSSEPVPEMNEKPIITGPDMNIENDDVQFDEMEGETTPVDDTDGDFTEVLDDEEKDPDAETKEDNEDEFVD